MTIGGGHGRLCTWRLLLSWSLRLSSARSGLYNHSRDPQILHTPASACHSPGAPPGIPCVNSRSSPSHVGTFHLLSPPVPFQARWKAHYKYVYSRLLFLLICTLIAPYSTYLCFSFFKDSSPYNGPPLPGPPLDLFLPPRPLLLPPSFFPLLLFPP